MAGASILLAKAAHLPNADQRGPEISTYSWLALRLCLLIGEAKRLTVSLESQSQSRFQNGLNSEYASLPTHKSIRRE